MCGIAGVWHADRRRPTDREALQRMAAAIAHRGPDGEGIVSGPGFGLVHRRLAIVDLAMGAQPMATADGGLIVVFNGEIYNHEDLRAELAAHGAVFQTRSDTEVLLHGYRRWGTGLAERLVGMFAFALYDVQRHELYAARDRVGKKPFYWRWQEGTLAFASELKALHEAAPPGPIDTAALAQYLALRYVPDPRSIFSSTGKLEPGCWLLAKDGAVRQQRYWQLSFSRSDERPSAALEEEALALLDACTKARLMGEVPLAPFLSGGIDSYAIVDSMMRALGRPVQACTIGFSDPRFDERPAARQSAAACGASLVEEVLDERDLLDIDWLPDAFDEPFADSSAVPTWHVCRLARRHVTVALSGDGGDENFCGYRRYVFDWRENRARRLLPRLGWRGLSHLVPKGDWLPRPLRWRRTLENLAEDPAMAYARSVSASLPEEVFFLLRPELHEAAGDPLAPVHKAYRDSDGRDPLQRAVATDFATWLPGDILVKADRASMHCALEVRSPFLDHRMVEFAAAVPTRHKIDGMRTKAFLRRALARRLDPAALQRKKQGFSVPLRRWMAGAAGEALAAEVHDGRLGDWLMPERVLALLAEHQRGVRDWSELLWAALVLGRFLRRWRA